MASKVHCTNLPKLVTKIITSFLDVNVDFETSLEIAGSLHIYSDGEKVCAFMIDEIIHKSADAVHNNQAPMMPTGLQNLVSSPQPVQRQQTPRKRGRPPTIPPVNTVNNMTPPPGVVISPSMMQRMQDGAARITQMGNIMQSTPPSQRSPVATNGVNRSPWTPQQARGSGRSPGQAAARSPSSSQSPQNAMVARNIMLHQHQQQMQRQKQHQRTNPSSSPSSKKPRLSSAPPVDSPAIVQQPDEVILSDDDDEEDKVEIVPSESSNGGVTEKRSEDVVSDSDKSLTLTAVEEFDLEPACSTDEELVEAQMVNSIDEKTDSLGELSNHENASTQASQSSVCNLSITSVKSEVKMEDGKKMFANKSISGANDLKHENEVKIEGIDSKEIGEDVKPSMLKITSVKNCSQDDSFWQLPDVESHDKSGAERADVPNAGVKSEPVHGVEECCDLALFNAPVVEEVQDGDTLSAGDGDDDEGVTGTNVTQPQRPPSVEEMMDASSPSRTARLKRSVLTSNQQAVRLGGKPVLLQGSRKSFPHSPEGVTLFPCHICGFVLRNKTSLQTHINAKHTRSKRFKCNICGHELFSSSALSNHLRRQHSLVQSDGLTSTYETNECTE